MTWLITGGCGFIGTNLISRLVGGEHAAVRVFDDLSVGSREHLAEVADFRELARAPKGPPEGVELFVGDVRDPSACAAACAGVETVVHLAANTGVAPSVADPRLDFDCNVVGTFNMLEASRRSRVERFIFASSGAPVGEVEPPITEAKAPRPVSPYGASKLAGEGYCSAYFRSYGLRTTALRFGNVYGPRSHHKSSVVAKFFKQALRGESLEIYGDGNQTRDFLYIEDLLQAILLAVRSDVGGEVFQIATSNETSVNEIAEIIRRMVEGHTGTRVDLIRVDPRVGDVRRNVSDISKARLVLGYRPAFEIHAGLEATFGYFKDQALASRQP
jgi:UDP-glucose 4-epimerase